MLAACGALGAAHETSGRQAVAHSSTTTTVSSSRAGPEAEGLWQRNGTGHGYYRWLVRTAGEPPSLARENRARGTTSWRLPGPAYLLGGEARGVVEGYVSSQSPAPGERESVYVSAPGARSVRIGIYRMGWYGGLGGRTVLETSALRLTRQPPCAHNTQTGLTQCDWHPTLSFAIPRALASGVYVVKLSASDGAQRDCVFVLRATRPAPLLVELPTASWEAYNEWGGDSLYPGGRPVAVTGSTQGVEVSYDRPYDSQTGAGQFFVREVAMVRFLERYGYPVSYTTIDSLDRDPAQTAHARAVIDVGHSEYWSARAARALVQARERGVSLIFISSDTMAWRVRFAPAGGASSQAGQPDHVIVAYKQSVARDPDRDQPSGLFPGGGAALVGSAYDGCITPRLPVHGPPQYRYYAWRPSPSLTPTMALRPHRRAREHEHSGRGRLRARRADAGRAGLHGFARRSGERLLPARARAFRDLRRGRADDALHDARGRPGVRHGHARLGVRPRAGAAGLAGRAPPPRPARGRDHAQPARARARVLTSPAARSASGARASGYG